MLRIALVAPLVLIACRGSSVAQPGEAEKIEKLIAVVAGLDDAVFIRNGDEHTCAEAADHLRQKWDRSRDEIETAKDFIRIAASVSSMSGEPYLIRWKNGTEMRSADFLEAELAKLEKH